jgi:hypothetical protein
VTLRSWGVSGICISDIQIYFSIKVPLNDTISR